MLKKTTISLVVISITVIATVALVAVAHNPTSKTNTKPEDFISATGTIVYLDFEGGFYGIIGEDGVHYDPINLSPEFRKPGLKVYFEAEKLHGITYHMWGTRISIFNMQTIE